MEFPLRRSGQVLRLLIPDQIGWKIIVSLTARDGIYFSPDSMSWVSTAKNQRARSTPFRMSAGSAATVARQLRSFWTALKCRRFPESSSARMVKVICAFLSRHPQKQSKRVSNHFVTTSKKMKDEEDQQGNSSAVDSPAKDISSRSEFDFIDRLRQRAVSSGVSHPSSLIAGIGDDAAVIRTLAGKDTVVTTDLLVEDIDFRRAAAPAHLLGHKALAVSLSDIAAMGARPRWALLSIGVPQDVWNSDFVDRLYDGILELAQRYDVRIIGGD